MAKILVVEDDPDAREILVERLKSYGYDVDIAVDGWESMMPKLDGYTACKIIREKEDKEKFHIPIIFLTAKEMIGEIEKAFACGGDDYVIKPVSWERLLPKIKKFLP